MPLDSSTPTLVRQAVDLREVPTTRRLNLDYVHDFDRLSAFFVGSPARADAWREAIVAVARLPRARDRVVAAIAAQQTARDAPPAAREAAARLNGARTVAVVTGQQAGLFGGPLYTLLKAVMAVRLAERTAREHQVPAVAVFWIDAEDHDWDEVSSCAVLDQDFALRRVTVAGGEGAGRLPVARVALPAQVGATLDELRAALPPTEFTDALLGGLAEAYRPGVGMAAAFGRWIERLLGPHGLVVFDGADPAAKPLVADLFARELDDPSTASLAAEAGKALARLGYHAQATSAPDSVALFYLGATREAIRRRDRLLVVGDEARPSGDLVRQARQDPTRFSPNVLLRPIVQDTLFPTVAYVAGPSEMAYLAQLRRVYERFGVPMPLIVPRAGATILDSAAARFLERYDLPLDALRPQDEAALNKLLQSQLPASVEDAFDQARRVVEERMAALIAAVPQVDPTLEGAARSTLGKIDHDLRTLHTKIIHAAKKRDETLRRQYTRARAQAFPAGHPQERAVGSISFLNRFGPSLVEHLRNELPLEPGFHWVLTP